MSKPKPVTRPPADEGSLRADRLSAAIRRWLQDAHIGAGYSQNANVVENYIDLALVAEWLETVQELEATVVHLRAALAQEIAELREIADTRRSGTRLLSKDEAEMYWQCADRLAARLSPPPAKETPHE